MKSLIKIGVITVLGLGSYCALALPSRAPRIPDNGRAIFNVNKKNNNRPPRVESDSPRPPRVKSDSPRPPRVPAVGHHAVSASSHGSRQPRVVPHTGNNITGAPHRKAQAVVRPPRVQATPVRSPRVPAGPKVAGGVPSYHSVQSVGALQSGLGGSSGKRDLFMYIDDWSSPSPQTFSSDMKKTFDRGVTHVMFAFYCSIGGAPVGPADTVLYWQTLDASTKSQVQGAKQAAGAKIVMSIGGGTDTTWMTSDATSYSSAACGHAVQNGYDGVDFDMENMDASSQVQLNWLVSATKNCAAKGVNWISHAPQAPYLDPQGKTESPYIYVLKNSGGLIDKLFVQYYNQFWTHYDTYDRLFVSDPDEKTAYNQLKSYAGPGYDSVFVVGKYFLQSDGGDGWVDPTTLGQWLCQAETDTSVNYHNGIMFWKHGIGRTEETDAMYSALTKSCGGGSPTSPPYPTAAPYPTASPYPTAAPYPTASPYPTAAPYPTPPAYPTAPAYPTPAPTPPRSGCYAATGWWDSTCEGCRTVIGYQCMEFGYTNCYTSQSACCSACVASGACNPSKCPQ